MARPAPPSLVGSQPVATANTPTHSKLSYSPTLFLYHISGSPHSVRFDRNHQQWIGVANRNHRQREQ